MNDNLLKGAFGRFTVKMILNNLVVFCGAVVHSYLTSMTVMCAGFFFEKGCVSFTVKGLRPKRLLPVFRIGLPSAVDRFYKTVQLFVINKVLLAVSSGAAIAAFADINTLNNVFNSVVMGFGASTLTMAGVFVGEGDRDSLKALFRLAVKKTLLSTDALAAAVFLAAPLLIGIFVPQGGAAYEVAVSALRIYIWYLPLRAVNDVLLQYYLGVNAMKMTYLISFFDSLLFISLLRSGIRHQSRRSIRR